MSKTFKLIIESKMVLFKTNDLNNINKTERYNVYAYNLAPTDVLLIFL